MGLPRLHCLRRRSCVFTSAEMKHLKLTWQAARGCTSLSLRHPAVLLRSARRRKLEPQRWGLVVTCGSEEMSAPIYPFRSLVASYLRSVSQDKQTSCLCVLKEICYWYSRDKRVMRHLSLATGPCRRRGGKWYVLHQKTTHPFSFICRQTWRKKDWSEK